MTATGRQLSLRQGQSDADAGALTYVCEQGPPTAAQIEHASAGTDPDLVGDIFVLVALRLFEAE